MLGNKLMIMATILAAATALLISAAHATPYKLTAWDTIAEVETTAGGWVIITPTGGYINCADVGGPATDIRMLLQNTPPTNFPDTDAFDRVYAAVMTAFAAQKSVRFRITGNGSSCLVERVIVRN